MCEVWQYKLPENIDDWEHIDYENSDLGDDDSISIKGKSNERNKSIQV